MQYEIRDTRKSTSFLVFLTLVFCSLSAWAQRPSDSEQLFSPSVGRSFYEIAYELAGSEDISRRRTEEAIIFLTAAMELDSGADYARPLLIKLVCRAPEQGRSELVSDLLANYVEDKADLEVVAKAVRYLLEQLNSREERETLLGGMLQNLGGKNAVLESDLATLLGLLMAEKADLQTAQSYLMRALNSNKYNKLAFAKLAELVPERIHPGMYLEQSRLALGENPFDMEAALGFAEYAERLGLYQTSVQAYQYCADLYRFLHPSEAALPAYIYLPWSISCYNTEQNRHKCLQIASDLRQSGRFDLLAEAIAGKAAEKTGDAEQATRILQAVENKALQLLMAETRRNEPYLGPPDSISSQRVSAEQFAWFYCFALPDAESALDWANEAYSVEPDSATAAAILAYSLVMNGQMDLAKPLIDDYEQTQISALALAQIQLAQDQQSAAIESLKSAIAMDPGALEAELAKELLARHGGQYTLPINPNIILAVLEDSFGERLVPALISQDKAISVQLSVRGGEFSFGSEFGATVTITNNLSEPLVISDDSLFTGNIRIDANITGDLNKEIPNLVSVKIRPSLPIEPGDSIFVPLQLDTGELRRTLLSCPQASLNIEFTVFVDPVSTAEGQVTNRLDFIKPTKVLVNRPGVELTVGYLRNRFNAISKGQHGQKIKATQLFISLLAEQGQLAGSGPLYKFMYADWLPARLKSALASSLADNDWAVVAKVSVMAALLSLPLDQEMINATAENLNDTHWPVRMMAIYLLSKEQGVNFDMVLDWSAKNDSSKLVRDMAVALGGTPPTPPPVRVPAEQPTQEPPQLPTEPNI